MKVVALLSGGKDSIYNLHHCILNNQEPVCVASLGPPEGQDELDSFMYQTVAHSGLSTLAQALDLPFYSLPIRGKPLNQSSEYGSRSHINATEDDTPEEEEGVRRGEEEEDETEDLYKLLKMVQTAMPDVEGVAAGAILSNYQRVRVEHVCSRLGLTPIAYLWRRDQKELLNEMVVSGQESVLVKVAGAGLGVQHLGKTLGEMQPILHKLNERYETHICGEGGEYETFTLDSPIFQKRLVLEETRTIVSNPDPHSTVAHLYLSRLSLADKPGHPTGETFDQLRERLRRCVAVPAILDEESEAVRDKVRQVWKKETDSPSSSIENLRICDNLTADCVDQSEAPTSVSIVDNWLNFSSISAFGGGKAGKETLSIEEELISCFEELIELLSVHSASLLSISHLNLVLSHDSMPLFPRINKVYSRYFGSSPPTRACVAVHFPPNDRSRIKLDGVARVGDTETSSSRTALHVQSLSYWGAANIGPYSQAITAGNRCYIAGQIPLIPSSLALPAPPDYPLEIALSLQHARRIAEAAPEGRWKGWNEGGIGWIAEQQNESLWKERVRAAREGWRVREGHVEESTSPIVFVSAAQLPRSASIEWQVTWQTGQVPCAPDEEYSSSDDEATSEGRRKKPRKIETEASEIIESSAAGKNLTWQCSPVRDKATSVVGILGCSIDEKIRPAGLNRIGTLHSIKAFHRPQFTVSRVRQLAENLFLSSGLSKLASITFVGSKSIDSLEDCDSHDVAFVVVASVVEE
ncbi:diphthine--ammonia ligase [Sporobolomyces salmoneus]|uniref:diphthine--ammonia ligase n=1 Tax=Sporobolomyces salmoneus TaxID=183962 RepID=UPI00317F5AEE